jgi:hypothetical protein
LLVLGREGGRVAMAVEVVEVVVMMVEVGVVLVGVEGGEEWRERIPGRDSARE